MPNGATADAPLVLEFQDIFLPLPVLPESDIVFIWKIFQAGQMLSGEA
jgi:hypothetical protein